MSFLNVLSSNDVPVKVNYSFTVILKRDDGDHPLLEYSYTNKNYDVELDAAFKISTDNDILKFE